MGKCLSSGKWIYGYPFISGDHAYILSEKFKSPECSCEVAKDSLGEFTGLIDVNGNEIYEGDIISNDKYSRFKHFICYDKETASFNVQPLPFNYFDLSHIRQTWIDKFAKKVIGNKIDNPELLIETL